MSTETPATSDPFMDLVNALKASLLPAPTPPSVSGSPMAMPARISGCLPTSTRTHENQLLTAYTHGKKSMPYIWIMFILWQQWPLHLKLSSQAPTPRVKTIQGKPLGHGKVRYSSPLITLQVGLFHKKRLQFLVLEDSTIGFILGRPWLHLHNPVLCWDPCGVLQWGKQCYEQSLSELPHPRSIPIPLASTKIESPEPEITPEIPAEYMAFQDVFSKQAATQLRPHRPWDCAIELLPGAQLPKGRIYPLSIPERQAMEEYIKEALQQGSYPPSTSQDASSFFFVSKKDGGLRPCIDYRQLNSQIIQQPYPLPLVPAAVVELRGA
ncbi:hypothetical protein M9458_050366 [Cirrhinus mrigala]|uniref:Uncharacterized protein n=1 Tax=Cirrhinus mrigala TaxID=683832 RepID=A0ABD0MW77_CIRMR